MSGCGFFHALGGAASYRRILWCLISRAALILSYTLNTFEDNPDAVLCVQQYVYVLLIMKTIYTRPVPP